MLFPAFLFLSTLSYVAYLINSTIDLAWLWLLLLTGFLSLESIGSKPLRLGLLGFFVRILTLVSFFQQLFIKKHSDKLFNMAHHLFKA